MLWFYSRQTINTVRKVVKMMNNFPKTTHWHHLHGEPKSQAQLKTYPEDFKVDEQLPFELTGDGEHLFLRIQKTGINTGFLAQQIAKFYNVRELDVSYAGRKDKHAVTTQWFSVWLPGKPDSEIDTFSYPDCQLLGSSRHNKKLRTGSVQKNHFSLVLRNARLDKDFASRIAAVKNTGVPNYYGPQRFGNINKDGIAGNLALGNYLLDGQTIRKREKRSLAISALRSWLFNQMVSERLQQWQLQPQPGDAMSLAGSNSFFTASLIDDEIIRRLNEGDIQITAPLWGKGKLPSTNEVLRIESEISATYSNICETLERLDLKQERRKIVLIPENLTWHITETNLTLDFSLPAGCFATSVIRELLSLNSE